MNLFPASFSLLQCLVIDDQPASADILSDYIQRTRGLQLVGTLPDGITAIEYLNENSDVDLLFLDVEMPSMNGIELLTTIQKYAKAPLVILSTGHVEYASQGYYFDCVVGFLQKVVAYPDFLSMVEKARRTLLKEKLYNPPLQKIFREDSTVFIKTSFNRKERYEKIDLNNLLLVKSDRNYIYLVTSDGEYLVKNTMVDMERKLSSNSFIRVHKSYLINLQRIQRVEAKQLTMDDGKQVPISESYRSSLIHRLSERSIEDN